MTIPTDTADIQDSVPDRASPEEKLAETARVDNPPAERPARRRFRYTLPGAWVAVVLVCLSFTPSLVPRPGLFQGVVCGVTGAIGYGLGVLGARVWREFADRPVRPTAAAVVAGVPDRRARAAAHLLRARAALAGSDPRR